ncbi:MAG: hypothetical protein CFH16_01181 [Alphaproteobacteria bacterium MarineAlpha5_Bin6]|nr:MAG: hypothetical protein CFH17_01031 [Alphaproteobacteria bacterium MarineAlpha5_Bin7]PPR53122.1 MAG: hypothetical protein CFH16_01181 [Alphaproteobacteria bacterium MarineAlpha5_Bin6]
MRIFFLYFFFIFFCLSASSQDIATIKLSYLIENSNAYINFIENLEVKKKSFYDILVQDEKILKERKAEIENSKLILNDEEINNLASIYNEDLKVYQKKVEKYNYFVNNNIDTNQKMLIQEIIQIVKEISLEKNFSIILNEDQYFLSSENIDISKIVLNKLNNKSINLELIND